MKKTILFQVFTAISLLLIGSISMNAQNFRNDLHDLTTAIDKDKSQSEPLFTPFVYVRQVANVRQDIGMSRYNELKIDKTSLREIQKEKPGTMTMNFPVSNGTIIKLKLTKNNILNDDFSIGINDQGKMAEDVDLGLHYRGTGLLDGKEIVCSFSFFKNNIEGMISGHEQINITSIKTPDNTEAISFYQKDVTEEQPLGCGTVHDGVDYLPEQLQAPLETREAKCVRIWWECNYNVYQNLGNDLTNTIIFNLTLFNAYHTLYLNESIKVLLHHLEVWTTTSPYTNPSDPMVDDRDEFLIKFQTNRAASFTGDLAGLITQNNIGGVAAGFAGLCNVNRSLSMCISGMYGNSVGTYPSYAFNVYITTHEFGHLFGSRHTHACVWNGDNTAIDGCAGYVEGSCPLPGYPSGGGTIMSYCWNPHWIDFTLGFGPQPGNVIRNSVNVAGCLISCCNPAFNPSITSNSPVCQGGTLTMSVSGGDLFAWTGPNGFKSSSSSPSISNITMAQAGTYNLIVTNAEGCIASVSTNVIVNPIPIATANASPNPICAGQTLQLSSSGGTSYSWTGPAGFSSGQQNPTRANVTTLMSGNYIVNVTSAQGCSSSANVNVTVNPLPIATASASPASVCEGQSINLSATGGGSYAWSGPGGWTSNMQNPTRSNATLAMTGTYTVTVTSGAGCASVASVDVTVNPLPVASAKADPNPICSGHVAHLYAGGGVSYSWSGPNGFTSNQQNPNLGLVQINQAGVYTVTVTNAEGCSSTASVNLVVNQSPTGTIGISTNFACVGTQVQLTASGGQNYLWLGPGGFTSTLQNPLINVTSHVQGGTYWVTISNNNGCYVQLSVKLEVGYPPAVTATHDQSTACTGSTLLFSGSGVGTYLWTGPGGFTSTQQNPKITNVSPANSGTYTLVVTAANGCSATAATTVNVVAPPSMSAWADDYDICEFSTAYLHATGASSYEWTGPWGYYSTFQNPVMYYTPAYMTGTYTVKGTGPTGCTGSASLDLHVYLDINGTISATPNPVQYGGTLQLLATGGTNYLWTGPNGFYSTQPDPVIHRVNKNHAGVYAVIISNAGGCELTLFVNVQVVNPKNGGDNQIIVTTTKIVEGKIYPNPANSDVTLQRHTDAPVVYSIIDMQGKVIVRNATSEQGKVSIEELVPGVYNVMWSQPGIVGDAFKGSFIKIR
ncbi:MAG: T9SS type A sorting domain-containing protein [Saprospiraceae bacterium]|nr:T9SS type A sorting domain-containing protein [Saprospiraceae bacterium]WKZ63060.1 MAG: M12 family metallo-peptidase [Saprospiraceae bacterium]